MENKKEDLEKMEEEVLKIEPTIEDFMNRRIHHIPFAKLIFWLNLQSRKTEFIYASELSKFMKYTQTRAYNVLNDLCKVGLMEKKGAESNLVEFQFVKNGEKPLIEKYLDKAKRTLGLGEI